MQNIIAAKSRFQDVGVIDAQWEESWGLSDGTVQDCRENPNKPIVSLIRRNVCISPVYRPSSPNRHQNKTNIIEEIYKTKIFSEWHGWKIEVISPLYSWCQSIAIEVMR